jgi:hypothetical protein
MIKCLSIRQPYTWAIMAGVKPVENRKWSTNYRGPLAIHAGAAWYDGVESGYEDIENWSAHYGVPFDGKSVPMGGIVGIVDLVDVVTDHPSEFFFGPFGWVITNPRPVEFVPMKGRLGLFDIDDNLLKVKA